MADVQRFSLLICNRVNVLWVPKHLKHLMPPCIGATMTRHDQIGPCAHSFNALVKKVSALINAPCPTQQRNG